MHGLHEEIGNKGVVFALSLEFLFLCFCLVFIGLGVSEIRKGKRTLANFLLIALGFVLAGVSLVVTKLLMEG